MANSRPSSLIIQSGGNAFDDSNIRQSTNSFRGHSSSSSIDSAGPKNSSINDQNLMTTTTTPTTTTSTESELDSEQEDQLDSKRKSSSRIVQNQLSRRVKHFQKLFKSELNDDMPQLIDSYVCAYQGDILLQGKMYITDRYLCFHSRIINYVTKHVHRWDQIQSVTKERVAFIFPTAIGIQLKANGKKLIYASFITRDQAFDKILLIWSRSSNGPKFFTGNENLDDEDENEGTLKANSSNQHNYKSKRNSYGMIEGPEQENVLQMYLKDSNDDHRRLNSISSKSSDEKAPTKSSIKKRAVSQHAKTDQKLSNGISNPSNRNSRQNETKRDDSRVTYRSKSRSNVPEDRAVLSSNHSPSTHSTSPTSSVMKSNDDIGLMMKILHLLLSLLQIIVQYVLSLYHQLRSYPVKTTLILMLFIILLVFHSFYLIQLAYRIEDRLQSLYRFWPSASTMKNAADFSSTSSMKNSLASGK